MFGQGFNYGFLGKPPCFTDTTDIFKDNSGVALYTLDYDAKAAPILPFGTIVEGPSKVIDLDVSGYTSGTTISDKTSNNNNATIFGNVTYANGRFNLDGASDYLRINASTTFNSAANFTVEGWFKPDNITNLDHFFTIWDGGSNSKFYLRFHGTSGNLDGYIYTSGGGPAANVVTSNSAVRVQANKFNHVVMTYTDGGSGSVAIYINGALAGSATPSAAVNTTGTQDLYIGVLQSYIGTYDFDGEVGQVRFYNSALTASEVLQNYNATVYNYINYDGTPTAVDFGVGGKSNYGARFNGSSSIITNTNQVIPNGAASFSFWYNPSGAAGVEYVIGSGVATVSKGISVAYTGSTGIFAVFVLKGTSALAANFSGTTAYSNTDWHNISVTWDGTTASNAIKLYVNGSLEAQGTSDTSSASIGAYTTWGIGGVNGNAYAEGKLDQVRIFSKALSSSEVSKLYGNGAGEIACAYKSTTDNIALPITNTAYYKLDNNSKDSARSTGKFNEGAIFNGTTSNISIPTLGGSFYDSDFSISLWVNLNSLGGTSTGYLFSGAGSRDVFINFNTGDSGGGISARLYDGAIRDVVYSSAVAGQWYHVVFVRSKTNGLNLYVDGVSRDTNSYTGNAQALSFTSDGIGGRVQDRNTTNGKIDQVRIYNVALSSTDVSNLYAETASDTNTLSFPSGKTAVATYQLDGNSTDLSGNHNGTDTNITYAYDGTESNIEYRFGRFGQAAVFDGSSSKISLANVIDFSTGEHTISAWVYFPSTTLSRFISNFYTGTVPDGSIDFVWLPANNKVLIEFSIGGTNYTNEITGLTTNTWYHIVGTFVNNGTCTAYLNGSLVDTVTAPSFTASSYQALNLGYYQRSNAYWEGKIDQVRIYDAALTSSQVTELYNEKPEVDTSNFKTVLYEGNGSHNYISNVGFQPDLVWIKDRDAAYYHRLFDSVRGLSTDGVIYSSSTQAADNLPSTNDNFSSFDDNGFTLGSTSSTNGSNFNGDSFVAWCWKAGGAAVTNTDGTITSQVSANTAAGFSIVKYTGNGTSGSTIGHGMSSFPQMMISKRTDIGDNWNVYTEPTGNTGILYLNLTDAFTTVSNRFNNTSPTSEVFTVGNSPAINASGGEYIAYCFHSVTGYSKIGSYSGNSSTQTIVTGFEPSFVMIKTINTVSNWVIFDNKRPNEYLMPSLLNAGSSLTDMVTGFVSNGFTLGADASTAAVNSSAANYIYMAFK